MQLFLSYNSSDAEFAKSLSAQLSKRGIVIWLADEQLLPRDKRLVAHRRSAPKVKRDGSARFSCGRVNWVKERPAANVPKRYFSHIPFSTKIS